MIDSGLPIQSVHMIPKSDLFGIGGGFDRQAFANWWKRSVEGAIAEGYSGVTAVLETSSQYEDDAVHRYMPELASAGNETVFPGLRALEIYLAAINDSLDATFGGVDITSLLGKITGEVVRATEANGGWSCVFEGDNLQPRISAGIGLDDRDPRLQALLEGATLAGAIRRMTAEDNDLTGASSLSRLVGVPLQSNSGSSPSVLGLMVLDGSIATSDRVLDEAGLLHLGSQIGAVMNKARARRESEESWLKAANIVQGAVDGIVIIDRNQRIENVNPALERLTGFSRDEMIGRKCLDVLDPRLADGRRACDVVCPFLSPPTRGPNVFQVTIAAKDGTTRWFEMAIAALYDRTGKVSGAVYTFRDFTERKEAARLKDEFISLMSHEFRSPVTVIMGMASTLLRKEMPLLGIARSGLKDILTQARRLNRLVDNLLVITRGRAGSLEVGQELIKAEKLCAKVVKDINAQAKSCSFVLDFPKDLPLITGDSLKIELVLRNLLENAVKYSPEGGTIRVWGKQEDSIVIIGVEDQGIGIEPKNMHRIFEAFCAVQDYRVHAKPGIGLGLAACEQVVEAHGGRLWAQSEPGKGSLFAFTLPTKQAANMK